jgi:hypothetical protein
MPPDTGEPTLSVLFEEEIAAGLALVPLLSLLEVLTTLS